MSHAEASRDTCKLATVDDPDIALQRRKVEEEERQADGGRIEGSLSTPGLHVTESTTAGPPRRQPSPVSLDLPPGGANRLLQSSSVPRGAIGAPALVRFARKVRSN